MFDKYMVAGRTLINKEGMMRGYFTTHFKISRWADKWSILRIVFVAVQPKYVLFFCMNNVKSKYNYQNLISPLSPE